MFIAVTLSNCHPYYCLLNSFNYFKAPFNCFRFDLRFDSGSASDSISGSTSGSASDSISGSTTDRPQVRSQVRHLIRPQVRPQVRPLIRPQVRPQVWHVIRPQVRPQVQALIRPQVRPLIRPQVRPQTWLLTVSVRCSLNACIVERVVDFVTNITLYKSLSWAYRNSHRRCSVTKGVLRNFAKFSGKHLCHSLFFDKVAGLGIPEKLDPGPQALGWDPKVGPWGGFLGWDPRVGP